ncbi:hypothetical protein I553_9455 [Mycobacterium xenopi 4042]|uniref:Nitric oxide reductase subunit B cytochrome c-like domain-containing protein n=1 Tax=Mycobacterium xenopi 4042 TaxID=1299334 RepID=X8DY72_MYCXE|nr:hypothetical protein I553_9455 [Mycobacterium xenopi 4042]
MAIEPAQRRKRFDQATSERLIGKGWVQGVALVLIFGFLVLGILAYRAYTASMPLPDKVVSESGRLLFTGNDITRGQELYQARGLMEYGSVLGHGAYLGPDRTAEYLRMATDDVADQFRGQGVTDPRDRVVTEFRTNRYNPATKTLVFTDRQARAFDDIQLHYATYFGKTPPNTGCCHTRLPTKPKSTNSQRFSRGRPGLRRRSGRATITVTPTTGRPKSASTTAQPPK